VLEQPLQPIRLPCARCSFYPAGFGNPEAPIIAHRGAVVTTGAGKVRMAGLLSTDSLIYGFSMKSRLLHIVDLLATDPTTSWREKY
jgi:hypothetical protein